VAPPTDTELHFEYEVPVQAGRGKSSYTDLMILGNDIALAIEAKFTEPRYESVATWLGRAKSPNRADVVDGWIRAIETVTQASIARDAVRELPYQLIHRTASACCVSRRKRCVIYQVFGDSLGRHYADDLEQLVSALRTGDRISFLVLRCAFGLSTKYAQLKARWDADERNLSDAVREALLAGPLMEFHEPRSIRIQPTV
jgi:hypothetical protein